MDRRIGTLVVMAAWFGGGCASGTVGPSETGPRVTLSRCTPGADQTCNDDERISALWGRCTKASTCVCNEGFEVNPATGRCRPD